MRHQRLMALVREHIADGRVLGLIEVFLKQGVIEGAHWQTDGKSMEAIVADINRTLVGWYGLLQTRQGQRTWRHRRVDSMRLRSILRKRRGCEGRGRDHQRWPNRYFTELGLFCLLEAKVSEIISLRYGANH